jgi:predicted acetyltransferase
MQDPKSQPAQIEVVQIEVLPATPEQKPVVANLLELYAHDFSDFQDLELGPDGRFGYRDLDLYWSEPGHHPFLIKVDGKLAGVVLLKRETNPQGDGNLWDVAEFFVLRGYRRRGIGTHVAHRVWKQFPGAWQVRVMERNMKAVQFWERTVMRFAGESANTACLERGGIRWRVFTFCNQM